MSSPDLLRRFTPTPLTADLRVMRRRIRLETNSDTLRQRMLCPFDGSADSRSVETEFLWRLVAEDSAHFGARWPELNAFTDGTLSVVNVEHAGFIALDRDVREAVGFIPQELVRDASGFERCFLLTLVTLTAPALGLVPVNAACLARSGQGVLIFGRQEHLKIAFDHWVLELEPRAEGMVFLEATDGLQAWGEFVPRSPHDEIERPFADLSRAVSSSAKKVMARVDDGRPVRSAPWQQAVSVVSCVSVEEDAGTRLPARLQPSEVAARLETAVVVVGSKDSQSSAALICQALARLPAYRLSSRAYVGDATVLFHKLLGEHDLVETSP